MSLHPLLKQQFEECRNEDGQLDLRKLLQAISLAYGEWDEERKGVIRSMKLLADETSAFTREVRESAAAQLQVILDHVKDTILTVDEVGRIETLNTTGERVFGFNEDEVRGRKLDLLIPSLVRHPRLTEALEELAESVEDTQFDLAPRETKGRRRNGTLFEAEIGVSKVKLDRREVYVVCLRDTTDRKQAEAAVRESEARYRTLVENAPEAIVVLDVDVGRFVECNDNAVKFFKLKREELLAYGPEKISPDVQADGTPSFGVARGFIDRALNGEAPCFEWTHRDAQGHDIPCEVRLVRLPSTGKRLIRGSITDITERKRAEFLAAGERRVFERITGNVDLADTLEAISETAERVTPDAVCAVTSYDESANVLRHVAGRRLPGEFLSVIEEVEVGPRNGSCAAAIYLQRQVAVGEIARDALWEYLRKPALDAGLRACWSTPIRASDGRMLGTVALYFRQPRSPLKRDFELMARLTALAAIAIERKRAETQLFEEKEKAQVTLQSIGDAVITADAHGNVEYLNPIAEDLTGWTNREAAGRPVTEVFHLIHETTREPVESPILVCLREGRTIDLPEPAVLLSRRGTEIAIQDSAAPIHDRNGQLIGVVMVFHDVSHERRLQRALAYQASHDALTGLINRREFEARLNDALQMARDDKGVSHVLMYLDLDQFKVINDTCGHQAGDRLLKQVTSLVQTRIRTTDVLARLGGDEFGILLQDCTLDTAGRIAENLRQAIRDFRFVWQDRVMNVGVSIGLAEVNGESETLATVMSAADVACYSAKDSGRNRVQTYKQGRAPERHREMQWVSRINRACEEDRLVLMCQPIVPIRHGVEKLRHFELLLRMRDENGQIVQPGEFLPAAERFNLMPAIDRWVVRQACTRLAHRRADNGSREPFTLAINISANSLNDEQFLDFVVQEMNVAELTPGALCFELTESAAMSSLASATHFIRELRGRGCRFTIDDFGSGLSSFLFLKSLPVDFLKIDGQFMHNVTHDRIDRSMVEAIAQIGETMGIRTVAERVDSADVLQRLAEIGIQYAQGHYIASPQPVEHLAAVLAGDDHELRHTA